ncbi:helix-turn-helix domain-containing protein [Paenibacillus thiaminolyticus]|uniref:helix-turn-helix domain-containing protein n=1 Tax=Paenibacillus thiaminolyticus TaxID=49283 RepID=UPI003D2DD738
MSDKSQCYPTIEMIARNVGCSSKSVERHIKELADKKLILVSQGKNNTYSQPCIATRIDLCRKRLMIYWERSEASK